MTHPFSLMVLAASLTIVQAQSPSESIPTPAIRPTLTQERISELIKRTPKSRTDRPMPVEIAVPLGLSPDGKSWRYRSSGYIGKLDRAPHSFAFSREPDHDFLINLEHANDIHIIRLHPDGTIVTALILEKKTQQITMIAPDDAQREANAELAAWSADFPDPASGK